MAIASEVAPAYLLPMYSKNKFLTFTSRNMLRKIALELDNAQRLLAAGEIQENQIRGCLERGQSYLKFASEHPRLAETVPDLLQRLDSMLKDISALYREPRTFFARVNALYHDLAALADMPVGEHHFRIRTNDNPERDADPFPCVAVVDNLRSAFNTGAIFRSSDGLGVESLCLSGITPDPENAKLRKTAMGSDAYQPWRRAASLTEELAVLKEAGYTLYALETVEGSVSLYEVAFQFPMAMLFGNEEFGILENALEMIDTIVHIPMFGKKNSFNVGVSYGMALSEARRQWEMSKTAKEGIQA